MDANVMLQSRYLKAADLAGRRVEVTIETVSTAKMRDGTSKLILTFTGKRKALTLNKTNTRALIVLFGAETDAWLGHTITLAPQRVDFAGQVVDAIRIAGASTVAPARPAPEPEPDPFEATDADVPF